MSVFTDISIIILIAAIIGFDFARTANASLAYIEQERWKLYNVLIGQVLERAGNGPLSEPDKTEIRSLVAAKYKGLYDIANWAGYAPEYRAYKTNQVTDLIESEIARLTRA